MKDPAPGQAAGAVAVAFAQVIDTLLRERDAAIQEAATARDQASRAVQDYILLRAKLCNLVRCAYFAGRHDVGLGPSRTWDEKTLLRTYISIDEAFRAHGFPVEAQAADPMGGTRTDG